MELLTNDQSPKFEQTTLFDTLNATSSPELADGVSHSSLQDGPKIVPSGPVHAPVNPSAQPEKVLGDKDERCICGPPSSISSRSADLSMSLGSRLQAQLTTAGLMEYRQTWKVKATPAGRLYGRTQRSQPHQRQRLLLDGRLHHERCDGVNPLLREDTPMGGRKSMEASRSSETCRLDDTRCQSNERRGEFDHMGRPPSEEQSEARERQRSRDADSNPMQDDCELGCTSGLRSQGHGKPRKTANFGKMARRNDTLARQALV